MSTICRTYNLNDWMTKHSCTKEEAIALVQADMASNFPGDVVSEGEHENPETGDDMYDIKVTG